MLNFNILLIQLIFLLLQNSFVLVSAFGQQTDCAKWLVDFILNKVQSNICLFSADNCVTENTCKLLLSLSSTRNKCVSLVNVFFIIFEFSLNFLNVFSALRALFLLKNEFFWSVINNGLRSHSGYVSPEIKRVLIKSLTTATSAYDGPEEKRREYIDQVCVKWCPFLGIQTWIMVYYIMLYNSTGIEIDNRKISGYRFGREFQEAVSRRNDSKRNYGNNTPFHR